MWARVERVLLAADWPGSGIAPPPRRPSRKSPRPIGTLRFLFAPPTASWSRLPARWIPSAFGAKKTKEKNKVKDKLQAIADGRTKIFMKIVTRFFLVKIFVKFSRNVKLYKKTARVIRTKFASHFSALESSVKINYLWLIEIVGDSETNFNYPSNIHY